MATMQSGNSLGQVSTMPAVNGKHRVPLTVHVGSAGEAWPVHWAVPCAVSPMQTAFVGSTTGEPRCPPLGLAEMSQVEAISNAVMAWYLHYQCPSGSCMPISRVCNGIDGWFDDSDEENCVKPTQLTTRRFYSDSINKNRTTWLFVMI